MANGGEVLSPVRDKRSGYWVIYQGGHHQIVCAGGDWHHQVNEDGTTKLEIHRCESWVGTCPVKKAISEAIRTQELAGVARG